MVDKKELLECCDVTPLSYEQYELRFEHYLTDERTGKKIKLEEPLTIRAVVPSVRTFSAAYVKNDIIERMIWELHHKLYESEEEDGKKA